MLESSLVNDPRGAVLYRRACKEVRYGFCDAHRHEAVDD